MSLAGGPFTDPATRLSFAIGKSVPHSSRLYRDEWGARSCRPLRLDFNGSSDSGSVVVEAAVRIGPHEADPRSIWCYAYPARIAPSCEVPAMKFWVPALLFSATVPSFCQSTPQHSTDPDQIFQMPRQFQQAPRDFNKPPSFKTPLQAMLLPRVAVPSHAPKVGDPHLDADIIHRPPPESFAQQQPRIPLAGALYPNLKLLPVETARFDAPPAAPNK